MTQPGDEIAGDAGALGCLYASRFDRVQVEQLTPGTIQWTTPPGAST
jgi:hypothetical protein